MDIYEMKRKNNIMMFRDELDLAEYDFDPIYWQDREKLKERVLTTVFHNSV